MKGFIYLPTMKKNSLFLILAVGVLSLCGGCKKQEPLPADSDSSESVIPLTVWSGEEDEALYNLDICSATDCTGLIPAMPQSANEISSYEELYHFLPRAKD